MNLKNLKDDTPPGRRVVSDFTLWYGNPATQKGYITEDGIILDMDKKDKHGVIHTLKIEKND
jgi:hypothetical protein